MKKTIAVWFSCGAASAVAAKQAIDFFSDTHNVIVINTPVLEEDADNRRFLNDIENWIGQKILIARNKKLKTDSAEDIWKKEKYMSGIKGAPCTKQLKKAARYQFECDQKIDYHILGFTSDEIHRHKRFRLLERTNVIPILIDTGITKKDCYSILHEAKIELPYSYRQGFNNANCKGCVKATSATYWNLLRKTDPDIFLKRAILSRQIGAKLVYYKKKRIFLDELPIEAKGHKIKSTECSIFCYKD